jgi:hypothetical protein
LNVKWLLERFQTHTRARAHSITHSLTHSLTHTHTHTQRNIFFARGALFSLVTSHWHAGCHVDAQDENKQTALHIAAGLPAHDFSGGSRPAETAATVRLLLDAGATVFITDIAGNTPRDYCSDYPPYCRNNATRALFPPESPEESAYYRRRGPPKGITRVLGADGMDPEEEKGIPWNYWDPPKVRKVSIRGTQRQHSGIGIDQRTPSSFPMSVLSTVHSCQCASFASSFWSFHCFLCPHSTHSLILVTTSSSVPFFSAVVCQSTQREKERERDFDVCPLLVSVLNGLQAHGEVRRSIPYTPSPEPEDQVDSEHVGYDLQKEMPAGDGGDGYEDQSIADKAGREGGMQLRDRVDRMFWEDEKYVKLTQRDAGDSPEPIRIPASAESDMSTSGDEGREGGGGGGSRDGGMTTDEVGSDGKGAGGSDDFDEELFERMVSERRRRVDEALFKGLPKVPAGKHRNEEADLEELFDAADAVKTRYEFEKLKSMMEGDM